MYTVKVIAAVALWLILIVGVGTGIWMVVSTSFEARRVFEENRTAYELNNPDYATYRRCINMIHDQRYCLVDLAKKVGVDQAIVLTGK